MSNTIRLRHVNRKKNLRSGNSYMALRHHPLKVDDNDRYYWWFDEYDIERLQITADMSKDEVLAVIEANRNKWTLRFINDKTLIYWDEKCIVLGEVYDLTNEWKRKRLRCHESSLFRPGKRYNNTRERQLRAHTRNQIHRWLKDPEFEVQCNATPHTSVCDWL